MEDILGNTILDTGHSRHILKNFSSGKFFMMKMPKAIATKIDKWDLIKELLHSKRNNQQTTCGMGENICKPCIQQKSNIQNPKRT